MGVLLETKFDFIKEDKNYISSMFLEPFPFSSGYQIEIDVTGRNPSELEVIFIDDDKNYICIKKLPDSFKQIANVYHIHATELIVRTNEKAIVTVKVIKPEKKYVKRLK